MPAIDQAPVPILYPKPHHTLTKAFRGAVTLTVGLVLVAAGAEWLSFLNLCAVSMTCLPALAQLDLATALGVVWAGIVLAVLGALIVYADLRTMPRIEAW